MIRSIGGISRCFLRDAIRPAGVAVAAGAALCGLLGLLELLWTAPVAPPASTCAGVGLAAAAAGGSLVLPVAAAVGVVGALGRWADEGAWHGWRLCGRRGRDLLPVVLLVGGLGALGTAGMTLAGEPALHRWLGRARAEAVARVALVPGRAIELGALRVRAGEGMHLSHPAFAGSAASARLLSGADGPWVELEDGVLVGREGPWRVSFGRWRRPVPRGGRRIELVERRTAELAAVADRTEAAGGDASYERAVWAKRFTHPVSALLLPLALLPLAPGRRRAVGIAAAGLGYLVAVRAGDQLAPVDPWLSALSGPSFLAIWAAIAWARWRDR